MTFQKNEKCLYEWNVGHSRKQRQVIGRAECHFIEYVGEKSARVLFQKNGRTEAVRVPVDKLIRWSE